MRGKKKIKSTLHSKLPSRTAVTSLLLFAFIALLGLHYGGVIKILPEKSPLESDKVQKKSLKKWEYTFKTLKGNSITLSHQRGRVVLVNFWASWCAPCAEEWPLMLKILKKYSGQVILIAVSLDTDKKKMMMYLRSLRKKFPDSFSFVHSVWDKTSQIAYNFGSIKLPETIIFNKKTYMVKKIAGSQKWKTKEAQKFIESLVSQKK